MLQEEKKTILGFEVTGNSIESILEHTKEYISAPHDFFHVVSLNPENIVLAHEDKNFKKIVQSAQITIPDGIGVVKAAHFLGVEVRERVTGVDLMDRLIETAAKYSLPVILIGAQDNLAERLADCYSRTYGQMKLVGLQGIGDIQNPTSEEERQIFTIVADLKPCFVFAAFGSPAQEKWFWKHRETFKGCVCVGVGGAFDLAIGRLQRAPSWIRQSGLEWLFRLVQQPWRWKRQLRLIKFVWLVLLQKLGLLTFT